MFIREAMQGHMMDAQIEAQVSTRYFDLKRQRLGYFVDWCERQGVEPGKASSSLAWFRAKRASWRRYALAVRRDRSGSPRAREVTCSNARVLHWGDAT